MLREEEEKKKKRRKKTTTKKTPKVLNSKEEEEKRAQKTQSLESRVVPKASPTFKIYRLVCSLFFFNLDLCL